MSLWWRVVQKMMWNLNFLEKHQKLLKQLEHQNNYDLG